MSADSEEMYSDKKNKLVLGNDDFCKQIDAFINKHSLSIEVTGSKKIRNRPTLQEIIIKSASYFGVSVDDISQPSYRTKNIVRSVTIYICRELGGYQLREIADVMGWVTYKAISNAICKVKADKQAMRLANQLMARI